MRIRIDLETSALTLSPDDDSEIAWLRGMYEAVHGGGTVTVNRNHTITFDGDDVNNESDW